MNVPSKFEVRSFTRSCDNRGYPKKWAVPGYAHAPFSPKFYWAFIRIGPVNVPVKLSQERVKLRTSNFVGTFIGLIGTKAHENVVNSAVGVVRAPICRAHCAVIFAIAQLSCFKMLLQTDSRDERTKIRNSDLNIYNFYSPCIR